MAEGQIYTESIDKNDGRFKKGEVSKRRIDLTGKRYGHLVVLEMLWGLGTGSTKCRCICDCGNETVKSQTKLVSRKNQSCGCMADYYRTINNRGDSLVGQRFGRLVVISMVWTKRANCECLCDCGNRLIALATQLKCGKTKSCGCYQKDQASASNTKNFEGITSDYGVVFLSQSHKNSKGQWMWLCKCGECGKEFVALPAKILNGHIASCGCALESSKERLIIGILNAYEVDVIKQQSFVDCKYKNSLRFDFAIYKHDILSFLIEYDGKQHFQPIDCWGGQDAFLKSKTRDTIKNEFCENNNIRLLRLPYTLTDDQIKEEIYNAIHP